MYRVISPKKLIAKRGSRTRKEIISAAPGLSEMDLYSYEKGKHRPSDKKLGALLTALNCDWNDISEPVELMAA